MQIDHDAMLLLIGAGIGLFSSLVTSLFQTWLSKREYNRQREQEKKAELKRILLPTTSEIRAFNNGSRDASSEASSKEYPIKAKERRKMDFIPSLIAIFITLIFCVLTQIAFMTNRFVILLSPIVAIISFKLTQMVIEYVKSRVSQFQNAKTKRENRIVEHERYFSDSPKCPNCGLPFISDYEVELHIKRWH